MPKPGDVIEIVDPKSTDPKHVVVQIHLPMDANSVALILKACAKAGLEFKDSADLSAPNP